MFQLACFSLYICLDQGEVWEEPGHECEVQCGLRLRLLWPPQLLRLRPELPHPGLQPRVEAAQQTRVQHEPQLRHGGQARLRGAEDLQHALRPEVAEARLRVRGPEEGLDPWRPREDGQHWLHRQNTILSKVGDPLTQHVQWIQSICKVNIFYLSRYNLQQLFVCQNNPKWSS